MINKILAIGLIKTDMAAATDRDIDNELKMNFSHKDIISAPFRSDSKLIGCIGEGIYEMTIIENQAGSDNIINIPGFHTGTMITISKNGDVFLVKDNRESALYTATLIDSLEDVIRDINLVVTSLEIPFEVIEKVMDICKKNGIRFLLYPTPALKVSDDLLNKIEVIAGDANHFETVTGMTILQTKHAEKAVKCLLGKGIRQVVLKLGSQGVIFNNGFNIVHKTFSECHHADVECDLFVGTLAVYISMGKNINVAIEAANNVNSVVILK